MQKWAFAWEKTDEKEKNNIKEDNVFCHKLVLKMKCEKQTYLKITWNKWAEIYKSSSFKKIIKFASVGYI